MTPPRGSSPSDEGSGAHTQIPFGLPLSRSPLRHRVRPFPDPQPHSSANPGSPSASSCSTPMCHSTPTSLHVSVLHPDLSSLRGGPSPSSPDTVTATDESSFEQGTVTPCKLSGEASLAIATPSPLPCGPKPLLYDSPAHSPASSVFPWHPNPVAPSPVAMFEGISEGCGRSAQSHSSVCIPVISMGFDSCSPAGGASAPVEQATAGTVPPLMQLPPFGEGGVRPMYGADNESGAVQATTATASLPTSMALAKDTCADAPASRSMIGSERPLSRPTTGGSAAADLATGASVSCSGVAPGAGAVLDALAASVTSMSGGAGCPAGDGSGQVNILQLDCTASRDSIAGGSPCEGCMSPVATPAGLNNIRLPRGRVGAPAESAIDADGDTGTTADMWAGASPFLSIRGGNTPAADQAQQAVASELASPAPEKPLDQAVAPVPVLSDLSTRGATNHRLRWYSLPARVHVMNGVDMLCRQPQSDR